jgi:hypothetical protein
MSRLFETTAINRMVLANRFVRAATWNGMVTDEGACTPAARSACQKAGFSLARPAAVMVWCMPFRWKKGAELLIIQ